MVPRAIVAAAILWFSTGGPALAQKEARPDAVRFDRDIVYTTRPDAAGPIDLKLNLARPANDGNARPCIVAIHGGAWRAGRREDLDTLVRELAGKGYVAATVSYRFCPTYRFPAQVEDCAAAVRFIRAHAEEYGIDPGRIGAIGFSAGAHLSMMLGVLDCPDGLGICGDDPKDTGKVQAVVSFFGPTLLSALDLPDPSKGLVADFVGPEAEGREGRMRAASPVTYVTPGDAPVLMFQGTADNLVPDTQPGFMLEAMSKAGVAGRAEIIAGARHGWGGAELERTLRVSAEFFAMHLQPTPTTNAGPSSAPAR
jgi:acetyl esterase/lipase